MAVVVKCPSVSVVGGGGSFFKFLTRPLVFSSIISLHMRSMAQGESITRVSSSHFQELSLEKSGLCKETNFSGTRKLCLARAPSQRLREKASRGLREIDWSDTAVLPCYHPVRGTHAPLL